MSKYSPSDAKVLQESKMTDDEAKWIRLKKIAWQDPAGKERIWESAERQTRPKNSLIDAVGIIAILNDPRSTTGPALLLQKQFRPPIGQVTIEVPAGLIDAGESPCTAALRELKEETGYIGTIPGNDTKAAEGFLMFNDPGFCNTNTKMVFVDVDMEDPRNRDPQPQLEENEYIETFTVPLKGLWEEVGRLEEEEGYAIDARVGTLAQGIEVARRWKGVI